MIDKAIKNIKKNTLIPWREYLQHKYQKKILYKVLEGILTAKISEKNTLQGFGGGTYSKNSSIIFFFFCISYI